MRSVRLGGINVAYSIWEQTVLPFLLHNCETWTNIMKKTMKILNTLFNLFHRSLMRLGTGCPADNFYWQTGSLKPEFLILQKQLVFVHHLANLPVGSLGRDVHDLQVAQSLPGLVTNLQEHINTLGVSDMTAVSKFHWKREIRKYVTELNRAQILESVKKSKKLNYEELSSESFERKQYFFSLDLDSVRYRFRISSKMLDIRTNFPGKYRSVGFECPSCKQSNRNEEQNIETQEHIEKSCIAFEEIRNQYDLSEDDQIVLFFQEALALRDNIGEVDHIYD